MLFNTSNGKLLLRPTVKNLLMRGKVHKTTAFDLRKQVIRKRVNSFSMQRLYTYGTALHGSPSGVHTATPSPQRLPNSSAYLGHSWVLAKGIPSISFLLYKGTRCWLAQPELKGSQDHKGLQGYKAPPVLRVSPGRKAHKVFLEHKDHQSDRTTRARRRCYVWDR